jgi:hypothetical protein
MATGHLIIGLNAVLAAVEEGRPVVLCAQESGTDAGWGLPYGPFDPIEHRTFEIGLREFVSTQTQMTLGFVEQLYTFGDKGREAQSAALQGEHANTRIVSVGYLGLARSAEPVPMKNAAWRGWYDFFPWEDWRGGEPAILVEQILPALKEWAQDEDTTNRLDRIRLAFGLEETGWEEERTLERYELLYDAGLVEEAARDGHSQDAPPFQAGAPLLSDHRRILATAIGRLRGKLRYRPVIFDMMPPSFTLLDLQQKVEALIGFGLHKQNFRRGVENSGLVVKTDKTVTPAAGRPAALFRTATEKENRKAAQDRTIQGLTLTRLRRKPTITL